MIKCCYKCQDRTVDPNCHAFCERYIAEKEKLAAWKQDKFRNHQISDSIYTIHNRGVRRK